MVRSIGFLILLSLYACQGRTQSSATRVASYEEKLSYLIKEDWVNQYFQIEKDGSITFYASPFDKENGVAEFQIYPEEVSSVSRLFQTLSPDSALIFYKEKKTLRLNALSSFQHYLNSPKDLAPTPYDSLRPLLGKRIALDPGHIEAEMKMAEKMEGKFIKIHPANETGLVPLSFNEANLTLATAQILSEKLEKAGAKVLITRPLPGVGLAGKTFDKWYEEDRINTINEELKAGRIDSLFANYLQNETTREEIYQKLYVPVDLRLRANKINDFCPDITIMIHYNVHGPNWEVRDRENYLTTTDKNYCMTFVPGSFKANELSKIEDRCAFLRLLLTEDLKESITFSDKITQAFIQKLSVPAVTPMDSLGYLNRSCILVGKPGVYARNLSLTRNVKGVLCYGESLCQDNITESAWLNQRLITVGEMQTSSRVRMVAEAYFEGVLKYYHEKRK